MTGRHCWSARRINPSVYIHLQCHKVQIQTTLKTVVGEQLSLIICFCYSEILFNLSDYFDKEDQFSQNVFEHESDFL